MKLYDALVRGLALLAGLLVAAACLLIAWDVLARNLGLQPPASTVALTEYALLYFTMAAAPYLVRQRGHIAVEVVYRRLGATGRRVIDIAVPVLCTTICVLVAVIAAGLAIEAARRGEVDMRSLDVPRWALFAPLAAGFGLMAIEFARLALRGEPALPGPGERRETF